jgi:hypothetical protein
MARVMEGTAGMWRWPALHWRRLGRVPAVRVLESNAATTHVVIEGLFCGWCARRTAAAFARVPGVAGGAVDLELGRAMLLHEEQGGASEAALDATLETVVVARPLRRLLARAARLGGALRRAAGGAHEVAA